MKYKYYKINGKKVSTYYRRYDSILEFYVIDKWVVLDVDLHNLDATLSQPHVMSVSEEEMFLEMV